MAKQKIIVQLASPERYYERCYHDFMDCKLLNGEEKIVFLALKRFLDVKTDNGNVFPTIETIQEITGWGNQKVVKYIKSLERKGVVKKIRQGLSKPNIYILSDYPTMWTCNSVEDMAAVTQNDGVKPLTPEQHITELERMGYKVEVVKEKELVSAPTKVTETSTSNKSSYRKENTPETEKSQESERYSINQIRQFFDYDIMVHDHPDQKQDIDSVMNILYDAINTTKETIRIASEDKPQMVVTGRLMKLTYSGILYAIGKYKEQTQRIKNPSAYMLTLLYSAEEQMNLDITNQVAYNMAHWSSEE